MEFVENDELETGRVRDDFRVQVVLTRQKQFCHHVVRQKNVGRIGSDALPLFTAFLTGVTFDHRLELIGQTGTGDELVDLLHLAVCQSVHGVNDDCRCAPRLSCAPRADDRVDNRHEEAQGFPRTRTGCDDITLSLLRLRDRLGLVPVKAKRRGAKPENLARAVVEITRGDEFIDRRPRHEAWVQRQEGIRPEFSGVVLGIDLGFQVGCPNCAE